MSTSCRALTVLTATMVLSGCVVEPAGTEAVGSAAEAVDSSNALTINALTINALTINALTINALTINSLTSNSLGSPVVTALQDTTSVGDGSRSVFHYIVGCALPAGQSVSYTWTDALGNPYTVVEQGQIGLAPEWATGSLSSDGAQLVSGCVAARVNYFGVEVHISVRNPDLASVTPDSELAAYPYVEGSFWGNLFSASPGLYSCYDPDNVDHSRADQRDCATGYLDGTGQLQPCGPITLTGSCSDVCKKLDADDQYFWGCGDSGNGNGNTKAITVGLQ